MNRTHAERPAKIQSQHLDRAAYVYVRQSSPRQVAAGNTSESIGHWPLGGRANASW